MASKRDLARLVVSLEAETKKYKKGLDDVNRRLKRFERTQNRRLRSIKRGFAGIISATALVRLGQFVDGFNRLNARVATATRLTNEFEKVTTELAKTAIDLGTDLETSIGTFQALSRIQRDVGLTTNQALALNRALGQLGVIGGTSFEAMRNGLRQLNQALANGTFRAEEFNSLVENTPELVFRIAKGLNKTQGELRQMLIAGKLLSKDVIETILQQAEDINTQFQEIPDNLARGFSGLKTAIGLALSELDRGVGFTETIASKITELAKEMRLVFNPTPVEALNQQLETLVKQHGEYVEQINELEGRNAFGSFTGDIAATRSELAKVVLQMASINDALVFFRQQEGFDLTVAGGKKSFDVSKDIAKFIAFEKELGDAQRRRFEENFERDTKIQQDRIKLARETEESIFQAQLNTLDRVEEARKKLDTLVRAEREQFADLFAQNLVQAAEGGFKSILTMWARTLQQMLAKALATQLFKALFPTGLFTSGGALGGIGKIFGRADGGPVAANTPFLVGERGPELFVPNVGGNIVPNGAGGGVSVVQNVTVNGASRGEMLVAAEAIKEQTKAVVFDELRRAGRL